MAELKKEMGRLGFENVVTLLYSGNVIFEAPEQEETTLEENIAAGLEKAFGFLVPVMARRAEEIQQLLRSDPFKNVEVTKDTRLYVSFLKQPPSGDTSLFPKTGAFRIIETLDSAVFSVLDLSATKTVKGMEILEKLFGKDITTRNWKTVEKIAEKLKS